MDKTMTGLLSMILLGCGTRAGADGVGAIALVEAAFAERIEPGAVGLEVLGKGVWYGSDALNTGCLLSKQRAFRGRGGGENPKFSPTYAAQSVFQYPTGEGYCVWIGHDLSMDVGGASRLGEAWIVDATFEVARPGGWWDCVDDAAKRASIRVEGQAPDQRIVAEPGLFGGGCPSPLPVVDPARTPEAPPRGRPPRAPTRAEVVEAAQRLDEALWSHDLAAALDATACYNLYEEEPFGACSAAELVAVGPLTRGELRRSDGPPWSMNAFADLGALGAPERSRADKTLFHVQVKPASGKHKRRTLSVQWVEDTWKLVGLVQRQAEGLTSVEYVVDLDRPERWDVFQRRLAGEQIDLRGEPLGKVKP